MLKECAQATTVSLLCLTLNYLCSMKSLVPHQRTEEFLQLYEKEALPLLKKWLSIHCSDRYAREEILAQTKIQAWKGFEVWDGLRSFRVWVLGILKHESEVYHRREERKGMRGGANVEFDEELHSGAGAGIEALLDWEIIKEILTEEEAEILYLHYGEDYSYGEIAELFGKKVTAIRKQANRAKQKVQRRFPERNGN